MALSLPEGAAMSFAASALAALLASVLVWAWRRSCAAEAADGYAELEEHAHAAENTEASTAKVEATAEAGAAAEATAEAVATAEATAEAVATAEAGEAAAHGMPSLAELGASIASLATKAQRAVVAALDGAREALPRCPQVTLPRPPPLSELWDSITLCAAKMRHAANSFVGLFTATARHSVGEELDRLSGAGSNSGAGGPSFASPDSFSKHAASPRTGTVTRGASASPVPGVAVASAAASTPASPPSRGAAAAASPAPASALIPVEIVQDSSRSRSLRQMASNPSATPSRHGASTFYLTVPRAPSPPPAFYRVAGPFEQTVSPARRAPRSFPETLPPHEGAVSTELAALRGQHLVQKQFTLPPAEALPHPIPEGAEPAPSRVLLPRWRPRKVTARIEGESPRETAYLDTDRASLDA